MKQEEIRKQVLEEWQIKHYDDGESLELAEWLINRVMQLMKSEQDKIDFNVVHMSGCNQQKDYCFCDLEIAKHKADTPSEKLLKVLWDSGISIPEAVQTKEELIAWLLDRITDIESLEKKKESFYQKIELWLRTFRNIR